MKISTKIFLTVLLILIIGIFIHPSKVIYVPKITGKIIEKNGNPIKGAIVSRIEQLETVNKKWGYYEYTKYKSQTTKTDENGNFYLAEKSRIEWLHTSLDLPFAYCYGNFEVEKEGYKSYQTKFGEYEKFHKANCFACEEIEFKPVITLKKTEKINKK